MADEEQEEQQEVKISVKNLYKIFGHNPKRAFPLIEQGKTREEILEKTGNVVAVRGVSFDINKKETFVIMGLSGSGKSTLIRTVNRLVDATSGEIYVDGEDIMKMDTDTLRKKRRYMMSMVFQHFGLLPHRNVVNNVEFGLEIGGMDKEERHQKAMDAIKLVGLKGYEFAMTDELSGGMQQRVGLARALANDPEILLMDEAFSALDPLIRSQMQDELIELQAKMHKTIMFITHDLDEALKLGDRILILGPDGTARQLGTPEQILSKPADDYVKKFVEDVDKTKVITVGAIMRKVPAVTAPKDGPMAASRTMEKNGISSIFVLDSEHRLKGLARIDDTVKLQKEKKESLEEALETDIYTTYASTAIADLLPIAMQTRYPIAVVDEDGKFKGIVDRAAIINEMKDETSDEETTSHYNEYAKRTEGLEAPEQSGGQDSQTEKSGNKESTKTEEQKI